MERGGKETLTEASLKKKYSPQAKVYKHKIDIVKSLLNHGPGSPKWAPPDNRRDPAPCITVDLVQEHLLPGDSLEALKK